MVRLASLALLVLSIGSAPVVAGEPKAKKPNIVFILADDEGLK